MATFHYKRVSPHEYEARCRYCDETLLFRRGDKVHLRADRDGVLKWVCCTVCFGKNGKADGAVLGEIWKG